MRDGDASFAGQMVVAATCESQAFSITAKRVSATWALRRDRSQTFERHRNLRTGDLVVAVASLFLDADQSSVQQLGEMAAGCLRRYTGGMGQLTGRQRAPVGQ
uniref:Uncharacterized protein n=1 Tax=Paraburkholderia sprentiae WSM5005 TaxID=754502 RepID=A0A1I9YQI6_9BURK